jgi:hypothetical protein
MTPLKSMQEVPLQTTRIPSTIETALCSTVNTNHFSFNRLVSHTIMHHKSE